MTSCHIASASIPEHVRKRPTHALSPRSSLACRRARRGPHTGSLRRRYSRHWQAYDSTVGKPALDLAVALSPPSAYDGIDALAAAGRITVPTFIAVGSADAGFPEPAKALHDAITSKEKTLKTVNDNSHGNALLYDAATMAEVITFIGAHSAK